MGRIPSNWWTLNCPYNHAFDIHRLNIDAKRGCEALEGDDRELRQVRYDFIRDAPDLACSQMTVRAELNMKMVMPTVVPQGAGKPHLTMCRPECGKNGNLHFHGISIGDSNPVLGRRVVNDVDAAETDDDVSSVSDGEALALGGRIDGSDMADHDSGSSTEMELMSPRSRAASDLRCQPCRPSRSGRCSVESQGEPEDAREEEAQSQKAMEAEFWKVFGDKVSEWNPCYTDDGQVRFSFDKEVGAHNVEMDVETDLVRNAPVRVNLRALLDDLFAQDLAGEDLNLQPLRRLVAALVQTCGRHDRHGLGLPTQKDACARGKPECLYCRYGFPKKLVRRDGERKVELEKGEREGSWEARFPRNDPLCTSYEPHVLLANLGNIDWRPCLNLWAVVEYICKYATKAPEGSRSMSETLRVAAEEVCKYTKEGEPVDFFRKALQKFYAKSIGDRDFTMFESVYVGMGLPTVFQLLPVITVNTLGTRRLKSKAEMDRDGGGDEAAVTWESKIDKFNRRGPLVRKQYEKEGRAKVAEMLAAVRDTSLYEFFWKYYVHRDKLHAANQAWALMVTPGMAASSAQSFHDRHEAYARMCVVAFWRHMPTIERYELARAKGIAVDSRKWGGTFFGIPAVTAATGLETRCLGIGDLVDAFEGPRRREMRWRRREGESSEVEWFLKERRRGGWKFGWCMALLEMLVDPILSEWVPAWMREQFHRWNPDFEEALAKVLREDVGHELCNREVLFAARRIMRGKFLKRQSRKEQVRKQEEEAEEGGSDWESACSDAGDSDKSHNGDTDDNEDPEAAVKQAWHQDEEPEFEDADDGGGGGVERWAQLTVEEKLSAAPPGLAPLDVLPGTAAGPSVEVHGGGVINPVSFDWASANFVASGNASALQTKFDSWRQCKVRGDVEAVGREALDPMQAFAYDIIMAHDRERAERGGEQAAPGVFKRLRMFLTGTAGTGKSRTVRASVQARRDAAEARAEKELRAAGEIGEKGRKQAAAVGDASCVLAAPTGCASFQMKFGAATIHRIFGVPCGFCGPTQNRRSERFMERVRRLKDAALFILDEFSMVGRQMLGKILIRAQEVFGDSGGEPFPDRDFVMAGDPKQAQPVCDEAMYKEGSYKGRAHNKPKKGSAPPGTQDIGSMTDRAMLFRDSFDDVVLLRQVHRVTYEADGMSEPEQDKYREEAEKFLDVTGRMADCTWTLQDHAFLQARNRSVLRRTHEGREELQEFEDAPLLVGSRKKRKDGLDGAHELNMQELRKLAAKHKVPIAGLRAYHRYAGKRGDVKAERIDSDEFRGMDNTFHCCEGARVMLTHNEWVEAGLMNGALGVVRGMVWPKGGDPNSAEEKKQAPFYVVVEFDDVDLGAEEVDEVGGDGVRRTKLVPRTFFPGLVLGPDAKGKERSLKCVPIFRRTVASSDEQVQRRQFPLTLAWALTHWKAQGMTLPRVRIRLTKAHAQQPGIGFVAVTRVKHVRDLIFDDDLPEWQCFQEAQYKANFRSRRRFELRLRAKASTTLRKYGFCSLDEWSRPDAEIADRLLAGLKAVGDDRRRTQGRQGDHDAWLWDDEAPCLASLMKEQVARTLVGMNPGEVDRVQGVAERLLGPLHVDRVMEVLGCLIPKSLHPCWDGKKPRGKAGAAVGPVGVYVHAGTWRVDIVEEQELCDGRLLKGMLEFYLIVLRRLCQRLGLPVAIGSHRLGFAIAAADDASALRLIVQGWEQWQEMSQSIRESQELLVPVVLEDARVQRRCVLVRVLAQGGADNLASAGVLEVRVSDRIGRKRLAKELGDKVVALIRSVNSEAGHEAVRVVVEPGFPECEMECDVGVVVLGLLARRVAVLAGESSEASVLGLSLQDAAASLKMGFSHLRSEACGRGQRDVLKLLTTEAPCRKVLRLLVASNSGGPCDVTQGARQHVPVEEAAQTAVPDRLKLLTWNLAGRSVSREAPDSFTFADKLSVVVSEIARWSPDIFTLQECVSKDPVVGVGDAYELVGVAWAEAQQGYVHLYSRRGLFLKRASTLGGWPGVMGKMTLCDVDVDVAAVHLAPGPGGVSERKRQLEAVARDSSGEALVVLGDFNVRFVEESALLDVTGCRNASYAGFSWDPAKAKYYENLKLCGSPGDAYDRVFFKGACWAESFLVAKGRFFSEGCGFYMSDHFGVMAVLDVDRMYSRTERSRAPELQEERQGSQSVLDREPGSPGHVQEGGGHPLVEESVVERLLNFGRDFLNRAGSDSEDSAVEPLACSAPSGVRSGGADSSEALLAIEKLSLTEAAGGGDEVNDTHEGEENEKLLAFARGYLAQQVSDSEDSVVEDAGRSAPDGVHCGGSENKKPEGGGDMAVSSLLAFAKEYLDKADAEDAEGGQCGRQERRVQMKNFRRGLCAQERDGLVLLEAAHVKLQEQLGRQAFLEQKAAATFVLDQKRAAEQLAEQKAVIKKREAARQELWSKAFGVASLFHSSGAGKLSGPLRVPQAGFELAVPGSELEVPMGVPTVNVGGLSPGKPQASSLVAVTQALLRARTFVSWLQTHSQICSQSGSCAACALFRACEHMGTKIVPEVCDGSWAEGGLRRLSRIGEAPRPSEVVEALLRSMRRVEEVAGRTARWEGVGVDGSLDATNVDRFFGFIVECRRKCKACGETGLGYESGLVLRVAAPGSDMTKWTLYDAYLAHCGLQHASKQCRACSSVDVLSQRCLVCLPEVLVVEIDRCHGGAEAQRQEVIVDEQIAFPRAGAMHLHALVFHFGRTRAAGHYTVACRGTDGGFWYFDGTREPLRVRNVVGFFGKNLDMAIYVKQNGVSRGDAFAEVRASQRQLHEEMEQVRRRITALSQRPPSEDRDVFRQEIVGDLRVFGSRLWGETSFRKLFFSAPGRADEILGAQPQPLTGTAADFSLFAQQCREQGVTLEELEASDALVVNAGKRAQSEADRFSRSRAFVERRTAAMERNVVRSQARRRRSVSEGMAALFSKPGIERISGDVLPGSASVEEGKLTQATQEFGLDTRQPPPQYLSSIEQASCAASAHCFSGPVGAAEDEDRDAIWASPLCEELKALMLDEEVLRCVLAQMQSDFGVKGASELACEEWLVKWGRWRLFAEDVRAAAMSWSGEGLLVSHVEEQLRSFVFALQHIVAEQSVQWHANRRSDEEALAMLRDAGFEWRRGKVWGENACLMDSLLQVLIHYGFVPAGVDRKAACQATRVHLESKAVLVPRRIDGSVHLGGYLEHYKHGEPALEHFFERFGCARASLPSAGFCLIVHSCVDDVNHPPDEKIVCVGYGTRAGGPVPCHLFNWMGGGQHGYHYDVLLPSIVQVDLSDDDDGGGPVGVPAPDNAGEGEVAPRVQGAGVPVMSGRVCGSGAMGHLSGEALQGDRVANSSSSGVLEGPRKTAFGEAFGGDAASSSGMGQSADAEGLKASFLNLESVSGSSAYVSGSGGGTALQVAKRSGKEVGRGFLQSRTAEAPCKLARNDGTARMRSGPRRVLRRWGAIDGNFDINPVMALFGRMELGAGDVNMEAACAGGGGTAGMVVATGGAIEPPSACQTSLSVARSESVASAAVSKQCRGEVLGESRGEEDARMAVSDGSEVLVSSLCGRTFLFDDGALVSGRCTARKWQTDPTKPVLVQCTQPSLSGGQYCSIHKRRQPLGIWDPPGHASLPVQKREEAIRAAERRTLAAAAGARVTPTARSKAKAGVRIESRPRKQRGDVSELHAASGSATSRAPAAPQTRSGQARIATGFGSEHYADWRAEGQRREAENVARGVVRRDEGLVGRMTDLSGADLDRSAGGAWHVGRR